MARPFPLCMAVLLLIIPTSSALDGRIHVVSESHAQLSGPLEAAGKTFHFGRRQIHEALAGPVQVSASQGAGVLREFRFERDVFSSPAGVQYPYLLRTAYKNASFSETPIRFEQLSLEKFPVRSAFYVTAAGFQLDAEGRLFIAGVEKEPTIRAVNRSTSDGRLYLDDEVEPRRLGSTVMSVSSTAWQANLSGAVELYWFNTSLSLTSDGQRQEIVSRVWEEPSPTDPLVRTRKVVWYELAFQAEKVRVLARELAPWSARMYLGPTEFGGVRSLAFDSVAHIEAPHEGLLNATDRSLWLTGDLQAGLVPEHDESANPRYVTTIEGRVDQFSIAGGASVTIGTPLAIGSGMALLIVSFLILFWDHVVSRAAYALSPLYTKLKKDKLLDVASRDTLYRLIQQTPGINFLALHKQVKNLEGTAPIAFGALAYHLSQMERFQLIVSKREGRYRRYFDVSANMGADTARIALLQTQPVPSIARAILESPRQNQAGLFARLGPQLGITRQALAYHLKRLEAKDLVRREAEGRYFRYVPTERLQRLARFLEPRAEPAAPSSVTATAAS